MHTSDLAGRFCCFDVAIGFVPAIKSNVKANTKHTSDLAGHFCCFDVAIGFVPAIRSNVKAITKPV